MFPLVASVYPDNIFQRAWRAEQMARNAFSNGQGNAVSLAFEAHSLYMRILEDDSLDYGNVDIFRRTRTNAAYRIYCVRRDYGYFVGFDQNLKGMSAAYINGMRADRIRVNYALLKWTAERGHVEAQQELNRVILEHQPQLGASSLRDGLWKR